MRVALSSDHRGFQAKERVKAHLTSTGHEVSDFGCDSAASCDYPDHALAGAQSVASGKCERGIFFCGTGIGMSMTANKVHGIRAALCHDEVTAEMSRRHNNANVLCLPADMLGDEVLYRVVDTWLRTDYEGGRHERRLQKIADFERQSRTQK
ncbi:MAG: ribose 5-phosphate isomerase B [Planctomycetes bacterium]|nr:ribose 5-phosphate isomerase B [Planctomycetota bacterium]MBI3834728.1 ribose 5-phosphate isomerase B [Planctomycetota bacterium]